MCRSSQSFPAVKLTKALTLGLVLTNLNLFAQLAHHSEPSATVPAGSEGVGAIIFWAGIGVLACVAIVGGIIIARKLRRQKALVAAGVASAPEPQKHFSLPSNGNGSRSLKLNHRPAKAKVLNNNHANGNNSKRRRMFNYHKFYTEMVLQGPSPSSVAENAYNPYYGYGFNGYYAEYEGPRNNNGNGHVNGNGHNNGNGHDTHPAHSNGAAETHASLIANQKSLIEEQHRLIQEQARLIEEKSRLIAEKNQLLDRQTQMLDNDLL